MKKTHLADYVLVREPDHCIASLQGLVCMCVSFMPCITFASRLILVANLTVVQLQNYYATMNATTPSIPNSC